MLWSFSAAAANEYEIGVLLSHDVGGWAVPSVAPAIPLAIEAANALMANRGVNATVTWRWEDSKCAPSTAIQATLHMQNEANDQMAALIGNLEIDLLGVAHDWSATGEGTLGKAW